MTSDDGLLTTLGIPGCVNGVEIGRGGFGTVFRAEQPSHGRVVAVKVLDARALDEHARGMFERECQAMGSLSGHPNIAVLHDSGYTDAERPFLVMEYLERGSLADLVAREGPMAWSDALLAIAKVAGGVEAVHQRGVLHRDIKPENILLSGYGEPKLGDFGIARNVAGATSRSENITASVAHAAPEVLDGKRASIASDVYSLGSSLYFLITGKAAFVRDTDDSLVAMMLRTFSEPVPDLRPTGVPDAVCAVIERCMAKRPEERYASAHETAVALRDAGVGAGLAAVPFVVMDSVPVPPPDPRGHVQHRPVDDSGPTRRHALTPAPISRPRPQRRRRRFAVAAVFALAALLAIPLTLTATRPAAAAIPNVAGADVEDATQELRALGVEVVVEGTSSDTVFAGAVISIDPPAGTPLRPGQQVVVVVSEGPPVITLPDVANDNARDAIEELRASGVRVEVVEVDDSDVPPGQVIAVEAATDGPRKGSLVRLLVSRAPEMVAVPEVGRGDPRRRARDAVADAGLEPRVRRVTNGRVPAGTVIRVDPPPGTELAPGERVTVLISSGPRDRDRGGGQDEGPTGRVPEVVDLPAGGSGDDSRPTGGESTRPSGDSSTSPSGGGGSGGGGGSSTPVQPPTDVEPPTVEPPPDEGPPSHLPPGADTSTPPPPPGSSSSDELPEAPPPPPGTGGTGCVTQAEC